MFPKIHQSWILKSFNDATATTDTTASAANKTWIFKSFLRKASGNTRGSLVLLNDCCLRASAVGVSKVFPWQPIEILLKDRYFISGSGIAKWFEDPVLDFIFMIIFLFLPIILIRLIDWILIYNFLKIFYKHKKKILYYTFNLHLSILKSISISLYLFSLFIPFSISISLALSLALSRSLSHYPSFFIFPLCSLS